MKHPLHSESFHFKGYWCKTELYGKGWKAHLVSPEKPAIYLEIIPQNSETLDIRRYIKELLSILSQSDKSEV